jgi:hypothetical protein
MVRVVILAGILAGGSSPATRGGLAAIRIASSAPHIGNGPIAGRPAGSEPMVR